MNITDKEKEVLHYLKEGLSNKQVAQKVCLSKRGLEELVRRLKRKTDSSNRAALVSYGYENGILKNADNTLTKQAD